MRTPLLVAALGLGLTGCLVGDGGTASTGGGDDTGSNPQGSGSNPSTPKVDITVDHATVASELKTANPISVTVTGSGGFSGSVALTAAIVDANQAPITDWTVDLSAPSVTLTANGTATVMATVHIPPMTAALTGMLKVTSSNTAATAALATSTLTATNQVTFAVKYDPTTKACVYPADGGTAANPVKVSQATKIRFFNDGNDNIVIHVSENNGVPITHQGQAPNGQADPVTEPNTAYEQTPIGTGAAPWYCHSTPAGAGADPGAAGPRIVVQ